MVLLPGGRGKRPGNRGMGEAGGPPVGTIPPAGTQDRVGPPSHNRAAEAGDGRG